MVITLNFRDYMGTFNEYCDQYNIHNSNIMR